MSGSSLSDGASALARSPLAHPEWAYIEAPALDAFTREDWVVLDRQRSVYYAEQQAGQALRMLTCARDEPSFGYQINNYQHCLQSATMVMRAGLDEETVVVALFHDIGFVACPHNHGAFAAALLGAYISGRNRWMLEHHALFQNVHCHHLAADQRNRREYWRGHPHFEWTAEFVECFDQNAIDADYDTLPVEVFEPMVKRIFARPPKSPGQSGEPPASARR